MILNEYFSNWLAADSRVYTAFVFDAFSQLQNSHCKSKSRIFVVYCNYRQIGFRRNIYGRWQVNYIYMFYRARSYVLYVARYGAVCYLGPLAWISDKNSSGDEIANVNFYAVRPGSYPNSLK